MPKRQATTIPTAVASAPEPRQSQRVRKPTERFAEGWFGVHLPRLSLALGVGVADEEDTDHTGTEGEALTSNDNEASALRSQVEDETQTAGVVGEGHEGSAVGEWEARRSERVRKATTRFAEGWFGVSLPRLSAALGMAE